MAEPGSAVAGATIRVCGDIENDVVRMRGIDSEQACGARNGRQRAGDGQVIKGEEISHAPADIVVRAGRVPAHADSPDDLMSFGVKGKAAAKDVYATDFVPNHRVRNCPVARGGSRVGHAGIDGVAVLQSIKAAARLDGRIEVRSGQRQAPGLARAIAI